MIVSPFVPYVSVAVSRALVVAELALGGLLAERLRQVDADLIQVHSVLQETVDKRLDTEPPDDDPKFIDQRTVPFMRPDRPITSPGINAELVTAIQKTLTIARGRTSQRAELVRNILTALEQIATDSSGNFSSAVIAPLRSPDK
jgi:hypothetical protein